jgi:hypothetical protein
VGDIVSARIPAELDRPSPKELMQCFARGRRRRGELSLQLTDLALDVLRRGESRWSCCFIKKASHRIAPVGDGRCAEHPPMSNEGARGRGGLLSSLGDAAVCRPFSKPCPESPFGLLTRRSSFVGQELDNRSGCKSQEGSQRFRRRLATRIARSAWRHWGHSLRFEVYVVPSENSRMDGSPAHGLQLDRPEPAGDGRDDAVRTSRGTGRRSAAAL